MLTPRIIHRGEIAPSNSRNILPVGYNDSKGFHLHVHKNEKLLCKHIWTILLYIMTAAIFFQVGYLIMQYSTINVRNDSHTFTSALSDPDIDTNILNIDTSLKDPRNFIPDVDISTAEKNNFVNVDSLSKPIIDATQSNIVESGSNQGTLMAVSVC
jgi:hypothetical protein